MNDKNKILRILLDTFDMAKGGAITIALKLDDAATKIHDEVVKKNDNLPVVTNQRELLIDFAEKINANCDDAHVDTNLVDWYLEFKDNL